MVLRINPRLPLVWRSPSDIQLGIDPPVLRLDDVSETQERMLAALVGGVSEPGLAMISRGRHREREELLELLRPALHRPAAPAPQTVAVAGTGPLATGIAELLGRSSIPVLRANDAVALADRPAAFAVIVAQHVLPPGSHAIWLRRDVPHLPVVLSESAATLGPIVEPGSGPCLLCLELHRRDGDPAWPAIAAQLLGRGSPEPAVLVADAAATAARIILDRLADGPGPAVSVRIDGETGGRQRREWGVHPDCGCTGLPTPGRPGSDSGNVARLVPAGERPTS